MTYLELVNGVLSRMREDTVGTVASSGDVVVDIVADFVNDAKESVERAHNWNILSNEWSITTVAGTDKYALAGAGKYANVENIVDDLGNSLKIASRPYVQARTSVGQARPHYYLPNGVDASADLQLQLHPVPDAAYTYTVYGYKKTAPLSADDDVLLVDDKSVLYLALAYALRERGEVGGQTAGETFAMAGQYLSDAIALDASLNQLDDIWYS